MSKPIDRKNVEIAIQVKDESSKAWRLSDGIRQQWVPKSLVKINFKSSTAEMPQWLAESKGFI